MFGGCFRCVILEQGKAHHFITGVQDDEDVVLSALDDVVHDIECYGIVGVWSWRHSALGRTGKW